MHAVATTSNQKSQKSEPVVSIAPRALLETKLTAENMAEGNVPDIFERSKAYTHSVVSRLKNLSINPALVKLLQSQPVMSDEVQPTFRLLASDIETSSRVLSFDTSYGVVLLGKLLSSNPSDQTQLKTLGALHFISFLCAKNPDLAQDLSRQINGDLEAPNYKGLMRTVSSFFKQDYLDHKGHEPIKEIFAKVAQGKATKEEGCLASGFAIVLSDEKIVKASWLDQMLERFTPSPWKVISAGNVSSYLKDALSQVSKPTSETSGLLSSTATVPERIMALSENELAKLKRPELTVKQLEKFKAFDDSRWMISNLSRGVDPTTFMGKVRNLSANFGNAVLNNICGEGEWGTHTKLLLGAAFMASSLYSYRQLGNLMNTNFPSSTLLGETPGILSSFAWAGSMAMFGLANISVYLVPLHLASTEVSTREKWQRNMESLLKQSGYRKTFEEKFCTNVLRKRQQAVMEELKISILKDPRLTETIAPQLPLVT